MARKKSIESVLVGYFSTASLEDAGRLLDLAKGITSARIAVETDKAVPVARKKRAARPAKAAKAPAGEGATV